MIALNNTRTEDTIVAEVLIDAPPAVVWAALTDARMLGSWWGSPETYRADKWSIDLRVGGEWSSHGTSNDGSTFNVHGTFVEITPTDHLVMTWTPSWEPGAATTIDYALAPQGESTRLRMTHSGFAGQGASRDNHAYGWQRVLGWLGQFAEQQATAA